MRGPNAEVQKRITGHSGTRGYDPRMERIALIALALLCGCSLIGASDKADAVNIGGGRYSVTGTTLSPHLGSARQDATDRAAAFCGTSSRQAVIESFADQANAAATSATFYCK
jgi:hypothetical protein